MKKYPSQKEIKKLFYYDMCTGDLIWKVDRGGNKVRGLIAGASHKNRKGYYQEVSINMSRYQAHCLIWIYLYGRIPKNKQIDHINHNGLDNRLCNLRLVSDIENRRNRTRYSNNTTGHIGVSWSKKNSKWQAYISYKKKIVNLGYFVNKEDAIKERELAEVKYKYHANNGKDVA